MKKLFLALALTLGLVGCANLPKLDLNQEVTYNTLVSAESAYGVALSAMRSYKALPLCRTGTTATIVAPCARRSVIVKMQSADRLALRALHNARDFVVNNPTIDASNVIGAAQDAIAAVKSVLNDAGVTQ